MNPTTRPLIVVSIGNSSAQIGLFEGGELIESASGPLTAGEAQIQRAEEWSENRADPLLAGVSVNTPALEALAPRLEEAAGTRLIVVGRDVPIPMRTSVRDPSTIGHDRLVAAFAAHARTQQACIVVDAGTAITVDFIDGEGVYHGGVIAPGIAMMLRAMHEHTDALPDVSVDALEAHDEPFGQSTPDAMVRGVRAAAIGLVHRTIDTYAQFYSGYPQVIATGGDARRLFADDELVEHIVPELVLLGVSEVLSALTERDDDE